MSIPQTGHVSFLLLGGRVLAAGRWTNPPNVFDCCGHD
jgi:hypothetical protein